MSTVSVLSLALGIGVIAGLRSMTAPAAVSWAAHLRWIDLAGSRLAFLGSTPALYIFSALAVAELIGDKLASIPARTSAGPLAGRIVMGGLSGAALCAAASHSIVVGGILGGLGALAGTFGGYQARKRLVKALQVPDVVIALAEDLVAIAGGFWLVSRL